MFITNNINNNSYDMPTFHWVTNNNYFVKWLIYAKTYIKIFCIYKMFDINLSIYQPLYKVIVAIYNNDSNIPFTIIMEFVLKYSSILCHLCRHLWLASATLHSMGHSWSRRHIVGFPRSVFNKGGVLYMRF